MRFARFMASPLGRGGRIDVGGELGWAIAIAGLLPITLGIVNGCILAPFLHVPFKGSDLPPS